MIGNKMNPMNNLEILKCDENSSMDEMTSCYLRHRLIANKKKELLTVIYTEPSNGDDEQKSVILQRN